MLMSNSLTNLDNETSVDTSPKFVFKDSVSDRYYAVMADSCGYALEIKEAIEQHKCCKIGPYVVDSKVLNRLKYIGVYCSGQQLILYEFFRLLAEEKDIELTLQHVGCSSSACNKQVQ